MGSKWEKDCIKLVCTGVNILQFSNITFVLCMFIYIYMYETKCVLWKYGIIHIYSGSWVEFISQVIYD
jgi:hypothetical protein